MAEANVRVFLDGDAWCALNGDDLQNGIAGFGDTPAEALRDFANAIDLTAWPEQSP